MSKEHDRPSPLITKISELSPVLNEALASKAMLNDETEGLDPGNAYTRYDLHVFQTRQRVVFNGLRFLQISESASRYNLINLDLELEGARFSRSYLRGFEQAYYSHENIAKAFLREMYPIFGGHLPLPGDWPRRFPQLGGGSPAQSLLVSRDSKKLSITMVGGGFYQFQQNCSILDSEGQATVIHQALIVKIGHESRSLDFGEIPPTRKRDMEHMAATLTQNDFYNGYHPFVEVT